MPKIWHKANPARCGMSKQALWPASGLIFLGMPQDFGTLDPPQSQLLVSLHLRLGYLKSAYARQMADDLTTLTPRTCDDAPRGFIFPLLYSASSPYPHANVETCPILMSGEFTLDQTSWRRRAVSRDLRDDTLKSTIVSSGTRSSASNGGHNLLSLPDR